MKGFTSKLKMPKAITKYNTFDLSGTTIKTSDFNRVSPIFLREVVPNDKFHISTETLCRTLSPLAVPTYGRYEIINRTFFVPMRTIMRKWDAFIADTPDEIYDGGTPSSVPKFRMFNIMSLLVTGGEAITFTDSSDIFGETFMSNSFITLISSSATLPVNLSADITLWNSTQNKYYSYNFTRQGKYMFDILISCGYRINFSLYGFASSSTALNKEYSMLPLKAFYKVFFDWYLTPQYANQYTSKLYSISDVQGWISTGIFKIPVTLGIAYEPDYFVSAWDNPQSPNSSSGTYNIDDQLNVHTYVQSDDNAAQLFYDVTDNSLTQYTLNALNSLSNFLRRNQLSGYRYIDRMLARYGVRIDNKRTNRSYLLNSDVIPMSVSEVVSQSDTLETTSLTQTTGATLGQLAGKSLGYGKDGVTFESDEFGYIIVLSSIVPKIGYYQGTSRINTHLERLDFFQPEFDNLGTQAIDKDELLPTKQSGNVWAFTPRYAEYKVGNTNNIVGGDLACRSKNTGLSSWHLMRQIKRNFDGSFVLEQTVPNHDVNFVQTNVKNSLSDADSQYDRIFNNTNANYDHFILIHEIDCKATRNMLSLTETLLPTDSEHHHDTITMQNGGTYVN